MELQSVIKNEMVLFAGKQNWRRWDWRSQISQTQRVCHPVSHMQSPPHPHMSVHTCVYGRDMSVDGKP